MRGTSILLHDEAIEIVMVDQMAIGFCRLRQMSFVVNPVIADSNEHALGDTIKTVKSKSREQFDISAFSPLMVKGV